MSLEYKRRVLELLDRALEVDTDARPQLVAELAGDDTALAAEVLALLGRSDPSGVLAVPAFDIHGDPAVGRQIGDFQLVEMIGRGGMGTVYLAERLSFAQTVAIKFIRRGLDFDPIIVKRFHNERTILARLVHPGIARLLDGGTTGDNLPYVVMEYIAGDPLDSFCRRPGSGIKEKLELFLKICDAVSFAHQNLIVHRDLKPGNIVVDEHGQPKLLDFGIAKLLDESLDIRPFLTVTAEAPMTPRYASPEQLRHEPVSTASDIYGLGVLLFEMLTGLSAYEDNQDPAILTRAVCEDEPQKPSTAVRRRRDDVPELRRLRRVLKGDLDSIVVKAMAKRVGERYASVDLLAADLRAYLTKRPISAHPSTWRYRAGKFIRRYRIGLAIATAFLAVTTTAAIVSRVQFLRAEAARQQAETARQQAETLQEQAETARQESQETLDFVKKLIRSADPNNGGRELTVVEMLLQAKERIRSTDVKSPKRQAELYGMIGELLRSHGRYSDAKVFMDEALQASRNISPPDPDEVSKRLNNLTAVHVDFEDFDTAELLLREALAARLIESDDGVESFRIRSNLGTALKNRGKFDEASANLRDILSQREKIYLPDDLNLATSRHNVAALDYAMGNFPEALTNAKQALAARELAKKVNEAANTRDLIGQILIALDRDSEATAELEQALKTRLQLLDSDRLKVAESRRNLAEALVQSAPKRAEELLQQARITFVAAKPDGWRVADADSLLIWLRMKQGHVNPSAAERARVLWQRIADIRGASSTPALRAEHRFRELEKAIAGLP